MSLFRDPTEHTANPPETWRVVKRADRVWTLTTASGVELERHTTRRAALDARGDGWAARLYAKEARWYAGESIQGWKPYAEVRAEQDRIAARWGTARVERTEVQG